MTINRERARDERPGCPGCAPAVGVLGRPPRSGDGGNSGNAGTYLGAPGDRRDRGLGLRGGDVILSIDERAVKSPTHAMRILRSYEPDERLSIEVMRHGRRETVLGSVPEQRVPIFEGLSHDG